MTIFAAHILVVDDVEDNRAILFRRLQRLGYFNLSEAADGVAALEHVLTHRPDLVLLDVMMPKMNGIEVLEAIRAADLLEETAVVMISAASETETVVRCLDLGAEDYLPKPFNPSVLRARIGSVLEKKTLRAEVRRQLDRLERELEIARRQQLAMVTSDFDTVGARFDVFAAMIPAEEVGGDLYDFFEVEPGIVMVAIGDVSGKGIPAALFMARARSLLRAGVLQFRDLAGRMPRPSEVMTLLNEELCKNNESSLFLTLLVGFASVAEDRFTFANAGHLPPVRLQGEGACAVVHPADPPVGVLADMVFTDHAFDFKAGDGLVLVTDGVVEAEDMAGAMYGTARFLAACTAGLDDGSARRIGDRLMADVVAHVGDAKAFDDLTLLVLCRRPS